MKPKVRILIVEDNPADAELAEYTLKSAGFDLISKVVETKREYLSALSDFSPDIILSDYDMPTFNGADALDLLNEICPGLPFILYTGAMIEERAIEILTGGATDYVMKNRLSRLVPAVERALKEVQEQRNREKAEAERDLLLKQLEERFKERTAELKAEILQRKRTEKERDLAIAERAKLKHDLSLREKAEEAIQSITRNKGIDNRSKDELIHELQVHQIELEMQNDELSRTKDRLEEISSKYFDLYQFAPVGYFVFDEKWTILEANFTGNRMLGTTLQQIVGKRFQAFIDPEFQDTFHLYRHKILHSGRPESCELKLKNNIYVSIESSAVIDEQGKKPGEIKSVFTDITKRKISAAKS